MFCQYSRHLCQRDRLPGHDYCAKHILEDAKAPYKACHVNVSVPATPTASLTAAPPTPHTMHRPARKCGKPAVKVDKKDGVCPDHAKRALIIRTRLQTRKRPSDLVERGLEDLQHYKKLRPSEEVPKKEPNGPEAASSSSSETKPIPETLTDEAKLALLLTHVAPASQRFLGHGTDVDPDEDLPTHLEDAWTGDGDSEAESVDSDLEDPLKHAGTYSAEEVIRIMRDKLIRLQKLYIDQFQRLQYLLREERRTFKQSVRKEKEDQLMSIHRQPKDTPDEVNLYEKIKALNHYNKPHGVEAVLHKELMLKRKRHSEKSEYKPPSYSKCAYNITESTKCGEICIPQTKFCLKHILQDTSQVLFRECGVSTQADDGPCEAPIPHIMESSTCVYHTPIQPSLFEDKETEIVQALKEVKEEDVAPPPEAEAEKQEPVPLMNHTSFPCPTTTSVQ